MAQGERIFFPSFNERNRRFSVMLCEGFWGGVRHKSSIINAKGTIIWHRKRQEEEAIKMLQLKG